MPKTSKITVEIPLYLKKWIDSHDISQNALVVMGLRQLYNQDTKHTPEHLMREVLKEFSRHQLPF